MEHLVERPSAGQGKRQSTDDQGQRKRQRLGSAPPKNVDLLTSRDENRDDGFNGSQSVIDDLPPPPTNISDEQLELHTSHTSEEDETEDDILDIYCSGVVIEPTYKDAPPVSRDKPLEDKSIKIETETGLQDEYGELPWDTDLESALHDGGDESTLNPLSLPEESLSPADTLPSQPPLCPEQAKLVNIIMGGRNVFYTGSAGCGKSTVLKEFTRRLRALGKTVHIVAPTGVAALEIGGSTTWLYAGWNTHSPKQSLEKVKNAAHAKHTRKRFRNTDVLVIDEISMVENNFFARLNETMKEVRDKNKPFGGVQLVVTGDFHQLPPINPFQHCFTCGRELKEDRAREMYTCEEHGHSYDEDKWAFRSKAWAECNFVHYSLRTIHRQSEETFIRILQKIRAGDPLAQADIDLLMDHPSDTKDATKLYSTREEVREVNQREFNRLKTEKHVYQCLDDFFWNKKDHPHLKSKVDRLDDNSLLGLNDHRFERYVELKQGMLVVLLVNLDLGRKLCNGSQGIICGYEPFDPAKFPKAKPNKKKSHDQLNSTTISGEYAFMKEAQVRKFTKQVDKRVWPIVKFHNGETRTIYAECSIQCLGDDEPYTILSRTQIPLAPAWAMTVHKSQSLTMNRVVVDLSRAWEEGQAYVALSRATSLEGLKIEGDSKGLTNGRGGNAEVRRFHKQMLAT